MTEIIGTYTLREPLLERSVLIDHLLVSFAEARVDLDQLGDLSDFVGRILVGDLSPVLGQDYAADYQVCRGFYLGLLRAFTRGKAYPSWVSYTGHGIGNHSLPRLNVQLDDLDHWESWKPVISLIRRFEGLRHSALMNALENLEPAVLHRTLPEPEAARGLKSWRPLPGGNPYLQEINLTGASQIKPNFGREIIFKRSTDPVRICPDFLKEVTKCYTGSDFVFSPFWNPHILGPGDSNSNFKDVFARVDFDTASHRFRLLRISGENLYSLRELLAGGYLSIRESGDGWSILSATQRFRFSDRNSSILLFRIEPSRNNPFFREDWYIKDVDFDIPIAEVLED